MQIFTSASVLERRKAERESDAWGGPWWVLGYIDSHGAIHARECRNCGTHNDAERFAGRCFRWNVHGQEFGDTLAMWKSRGNAERLDRDDVVAVMDWLEREGYKDSDMEETTPE